jgi:hypothetical protein
VSRLLARSLQQLRERGELGGASFAQG